MPDKSDESGSHDSYDDKERPDPLIPRNIKKKPDSPTAVAIKNARKNKSDERPRPVVTAAGREKLAERILNLAFENGVRVREDKALANILATLEIDSPVPEEAFLAVAEILSKVYQANGQDDPFNAILNPEAENPEAENNVPGPEEKEGDAQNQETS